MNQTQSSLQINALDKYTSRAPQHVLSAIKSASQASGVDFSYLVQQAAAESNFDTDIKAKTSSATGLYQFIDSTWLSMVERYGEDYGIKTDGMDRSEILEMRIDPKKSSFMAAAFASENEKHLNNNWGGEVGSTELYFAHFMGASGATSFLQARDEMPLVKAADLFPKAASANRNVFYDRETGQERSIEDVYQFFAKKFNSSTSPQPPKQQETATTYMAHNSLYRPDMNNPIMKRAQEMRDNAILPTNQDSFGALYSMERVSSFGKQNSIFSNMMSHQLDLILLTQDVTNNAILSKEDT